jgi:hypothetical protein
MYLAHRTADKERKAKPWYRSGRGRVLIRISQGMSQVPDGRMEQPIWMLAGERGEGDTKRRNGGTAFCHAYSIVVRSIILSSIIMLPCGGHRN